MVDTVALVLATASFVLAIETRLWGRDLERRWRVLATDTRTTLASVLLRSPDEPKGSAE
jgi:hypothetical protein